MNTNEIKWDKQNLIPAIIQNTHTLNILMLGYMSEESIKQSLKTNEVTFFSRSKQRLWVKGETSGNKLIIDNIELDCDKDALLIKATPKGPTCHLGTESCFRVEDNLNINIFEKLESIIENRKNSQLDNSYVASLFAKGIKLKGYSEIEVIANLYKLYSDKFVDLLDGMYAIAILDYKKQSFVLFRDPYGIKPIYWTLENGNFAFSSDLTPLKSCFTKNTLNTNAIHEYLFHGYCSSNNCIASNIYKIPPSSFLKFEKNRVFTGKYNSFTQNKYIEDFNYSIDNIDSLLKKTVSDQIAKEVPMGIMLSGGIDSSLLAKYLSLDKKMPKNIKGYSVRYLDKKLSNDYSCAESLAKQLNLNHETSYSLLTFYS